MSDAGKRAQGALTGFLLGDSLGMPTRSLNPEDVLATYGLITGLGAADSEHPRYPGMSAGSVTEITDQMMIVGRFAHDDGGVNSSRIGQACLRGDRRGVGPVGSGSRGKRTRPFHHFAAGGDHVEMAPSTSVEAACAVPIGIAHGAEGDENALLEDIDALCRAGRYTRPTVEAASLVAHTISSLIDGACIDDAIDAALAIVAASELRGEWTGEASVVARTLQAMDWAADLRDVELLGHIHMIVGSSGAAGEVVPSALILAKAYADEPFSGLCAISQLGGDSSLRGSIAGAILGATSGPSVFPASVCREVDGLDKAVDLADRLLALSGRDSRIWEARPL